MSWHHSGDSGEPDWEEAEYRRRLLRTMIIALVLLAALLFVVFAASVFGLIGGSAPPARELLLSTPMPESPPVLGAGGGGVEFTSSVEAAIPTVGPPPGPPPELSPTFAGFYAARGGERILGRPLTAPAIVNGREIQWFERARIEHWPEYLGTPYELQLGRLGVEFTQGREFARQGFFVSTPDLRYFPETGHAVGGVFLRFWEQNGGLASFGFPISEAFDEVLPDGLAYRVQYFERARMEYHPQHAGTPHEVQLGLIGTALLYNEARPATVQPVPTQVPLP